TTGEKRRFSRIMNCCPRGKLSVLPDIVNPTRHPAVSVPAAAPILADRIAGGNGKSDLSFRGKLPYRRAPDAFAPRPARCSATLLRRCRARRKTEFRPQHLRPRRRRLRARREAHGAG